MKELIRKLCTCDAASGSEKAVRDYIMNEIVNYVEECKIDSIGNLIAYKRGKSRGRNRLMLVSHMDEVALRVQSINENGTIKFIPVGKIEVTSLPGSVVRSNAGIKAAVVFANNPSGKKPSFDDLVIDCGAQSKSAAESVVSVGDFFVFDSEFIELPNGNISDKAFEDRLGCAVLIDLIKKDLQYDAWFVFSACGELVSPGEAGRGAGIAAERVSPDICLAINCRGVADFPNVPVHKQQAKVGFGAIVPLSDHGAGYYRPLRTCIEKAASDKGILWQNLAARGQISDQSSVYTANIGVKLSALAIPVRNIYTGHSLANLNDITSVRDIAYIFIEKAGEFNV